MKLVSKAALAQVLRDMATRIEQDDSFEGGITYVLDDDCEGFRVAGAYRIGNRDGQGGMRIIE